MNFLMESSCSLSSTQRMVFFGLTECPRRSARGPAPANDDSRSRKESRDSPASVIARLDAGRGVLKSSVVCSFSLGETSFFLGRSSLTDPVNARSYYGAGQAV